MAEWYTTRPSGYPDWWLDNRLYVQDWYRTQASPDLDGIDADAQLFLDAVDIYNWNPEEHDIPAIKSAINSFVVGLKGNNLWTGRVAIYPNVGGTAATHKYNLKDPRDLDAAFRKTFYGGITHDANGITPNGTTGYADTHIDLNANYTQYSLEMSFYCSSTSFPVADDSYAMGVVDLGIDFFKPDGVYFSPAQKRYDTGTSVAIQANIGTNPKCLITAIARHYDELVIYKNGVSVASSSLVRDGYFPGRDPNNPRSLWLYGLNNNGSLAFPSSLSSYFESVGETMSSSEVAIYNTLVQQLKTGLGR